MTSCPASKVTEMIRRAWLIGLASAIFVISMLTGASSQSKETYHYYFGNTHSHTRNSDGGKSTAVEHFTLAKAAGFDFYAVTDHALAKYPNFTPKSYEETKHQADVFTDSKFVGIAGFEFSENDGPKGKGHLTALNTASYLDATGRKVNLPVFYDWLVSKQTTTVAAVFNHAGPTTYNSYDYLTPARRDVVTMFEMINSGKLHEKGFLAALKKGWRVAPMAGMDNHGTGKIKSQSYRTGVLATSLTRENIMQAMRARRVYCTWDKDLHVTFSANGSIMGSVITSPKSLEFTVDVSDPDTSDLGDKITKIEIVGGNGKLVASKDFSAHTASFSASTAPGCKYYFVKVYAADKTDGPTAYSAPIWIDDSAAKPATPTK